VFLTAITRRADTAPDPAAFPWTLPLLQGLDELRLDRPVVFLVGENGVG
jgi:predicted ATPase